MRKRFVAHFWAQLLHSDDVLGELSVVVLGIWDTSSAHRLAFPFIFRIRGSSLSLSLLLSSFFPSPSSHLNFSASGSLQYLGAGAAVSWGWDIWFRWLLVGFLDLRCVD